MAVALPAFASLASYAVPKLLEKSPEIAEMVAKYAPTAIKAGGKIANTLFSKSGRKSVSNFLKSRATPKGLIKLISKDIPSLKNQFDGGIGQLQRDADKLGLAGVSESLKMAQRGTHNVYNKFVDRPRNNLMHFFPPPQMPPQ